MLNDPRHRNKIFDTTSIGAYLRDYADQLSDALLTVDAEQLDLARAALEKASADGRRIFAIGNGGSAAIAEHLSCDLTKGTHCEGHPIIDTMSMASNTALYSAIANDYGFENVFSTQVGFLGKKGDVLLAISSSGNSPNIVSAVKKARELGMTTVGVSGFKGGLLKDDAEISLYTAADNYGIVEDAHQALMHILAQFIATHRDHAHA